jgi:hypothetical protein
MIYFSNRSFLRTFWNFFRKGILFSKSKFMSILVQMQRWSELMPLSQILFITFILDNGWLQVMKSISLLRPPDSWSLVTIKLFSGWAADRLNSLISLLRSNLYLLKSPATMMVSSEYFWVILFRIILNFSSHFFFLK